MKRSSADQDNVIVLHERTVEFDRDAAFRFADPGDLHEVLRIVIESLQSLRDERREYLALLVFGDRAMDAGREYRGHLMRRGSICDKASHEKVDDLAACRAASGIGNNEEH